MTETESEAVLENQDHVLTIRLNQSPASNAIESSAPNTLDKELEASEGDSGSQKGIITGTGSASSASQDLKSIATGDPIILENHSKLDFARWVGHHCRKPVVGAPKGYAFGRALACDLVVTTSDAIVGLPEVSRGHFAASAPQSAQQLTQKERDTNSASRGATDNNERGIPMGLIHEAAPAKHVFLAAPLVGELIIENAPVAVHVSKQIITQKARTDAWAPEFSGTTSQEHEKVFSSDDSLEGVESLGEKRKRTWRVQ